MRFEIPNLQKKEEKKSFKAPPTWNAIAPGKKRGIRAGGTRIWIIPSSGKWKINHPIGARATRAREGGRKMGMILHGFIPEHPWDGMDQLPAGLSAPRKKKKKKRI